MLAVGICSCFFIRLRIYSYLPLLRILRILNQELMLDFISWFFWVWMIMWFFFCGLLIWWVTLIDIWMLSEHCIPRINPALSWCIICLIYHQIHFAEVLLEVCIYVYERYFSIVFFTYVCVWLGYQDDVCLI